MSHFYTETKQQFASHTLRLQINSRQTGSAAESYFAGVVFRNIGQQ